jgi:hypothetical protein
MMVAVRTSGTSVNFYETSRQNIQHGCQLHNQRRENLKSHKVKTAFMLPRKVAVTIIIL